MGVLILILLILAALTGVFWTVLKITAIALLSTVLTLILLGWLGYYLIRRRFRRFVDQHERGAASPSRAPYPTEGRKESDPGLPPGS